MFPLEVHIPLKVREENERIKLTIKEGGGGLLPIYTGETSVIPKTFEQSLETANTSVLSDITVLQIPYSQVSNPSGGLTVSIAFEG